MSARPSPLRFAMATALAVPLAASLAACTEDGSDAYFGTTQRTGKDPATLYANAYGEPETIDPGLSHDWSSGGIILQLFEGLTAYDPKDSHPIQGVAVRWDQSDDNRIYRFHLRPDAKWSDGRPVTAHDFAYAWRRVLRPRTGSRAATNLYILKNGELFHKGKIRTARVDTVLRTEPRGGPNAPGAPLPKGAAVILVDEPPGGARGGYVLVARHRALPSYRPSNAASPPPSPPSSPSSLSPPSPPSPLSERGYIHESEIAEDDSVIGVRAAGDLALDVELEQPAPYFLDLTSSQNLLPVRQDVIEAFEQRGEPELWTRPEGIVTNGPFMLEDWRFRYEIVMKQNPHYWDASRMRVRRIVWLLVDNQHATMNLYKAGEIDMMGDTSLPAAYIASLSGKRDFVQYPWLGSYWYNFNAKKPPLDDARVRRALNLATDKRQIIDKVLRGGQPLATHYVPDYVGFGYAEQAEADRAAGADPFSAPEAVYNPERARALLEEAGYPVERQGDGYLARGLPPIEILYNTVEEHRQVAVAVQDMWKRNLGVSATLRSEEWRVMLKSIRDGQYQVARLGWVADYNHPHTWLSSFMSDNPQNSTGCKNPAFDALIEQAARTSDRLASIRLYRRAEKMALDDMCRMPIYFRSRSTFIKPWVKGFHGNPRDVHVMKWLWIDPSWREAQTGMEMGTGTGTGTDRKNREREGEPALLPFELPEPGRIEAP